MDAAKSVRRDVKTCHNKTRSPNKLQVSELSCKRRQFIAVMGKTLQQSLNLSQVSQIFKFNPSSGEAHMLTVEHCPAATSSQCFVDVWIAMGINHKSYFLILKETLCFYVLCLIFSNYTFKPSKDLAKKFFQKDKDSIV